MCAKYSARVLTRWTKSELSCMVCTFWVMVLTISPVARFDPAMEMHLACESTYGMADN